MPWQGKQVLSLEDNKLHSILFDSDTLRPLGRGVDDADLWQISIEARFPGMKAQTIVAVISESKGDISLNSSNLAMLTNAAALPTDRSKKVEKAADTAPSTPPQMGILSDDGHYLWDGTAWRLVDASPPSSTPARQTQVGDLSEDGYYIWDGADWKPATDETDGSFQEQVLYLSQLVQAVQQEPRNLEF